MRKAIIVALTLATAGIHLAYSAPNFDGVMMGLSGLGYLALLGLLYLPIPATRAHHRLIRRALIGYAAVIVAGYILYGLVTGEWSIPLGPVAKVIELALITLLWQEERRRVTAEPEMQRGSS